MLVLRSSLSFFLVTIKQNKTSLSFTCVVTGVTVGDPGAKSGLGKSFEWPVEMCTSYEEMKREILRAEGKTPDQIGKILTSMKHEGDSTRQFCTKLKKVLLTFLMLPKKAQVNQMIRL